MTYELNPEEEARTILDRMRQGGMWEPMGLGLCYVKTGDKSVSLASQENTPISAQARIRMRMLIENIGWKGDETETKIVNVENLDPAERHMRAMQMRQEQAQNWKCDCGTPLSAFPLEEGVWNFYGQEEMTAPDGETGVVEQWAVVISCPVCDKEIPVEPYDYALLAGDDAMITVKTKSMEYTALDRVEIIKRVDDKVVDSVMILGTFCPMSGELLPPHARGAVVSFRKIEEEE